MPALTSLLMNRRYDVELLAESGMSTVYAGRDRQTGSEVVVKAVPSSDFELSSALVREREMLIRLDHPGIVRVIELFAEDGLTALVLEKVPGSDLGQLLTLGDERPGEERVREWGIEIAGALLHLHRQSPPIVYRDLKPSNIILRPDGRLVLVDFGAARVVRNEAARDTVQLGTPGYAAPEQYAACATDERADVYALGVTLFELLSRRDPRSFGFTFPPLSELGVTVSGDFEAVVQRALSPSARDRFPSMSAMLEALKACRPGGRFRPGVLLPAAVLASGAAAANVLAQTWAQRYAAGLLVFGLSAVAGLLISRRRLSPQDLDVSTWRRRIPIALLLVLAAALGTAPLALPVHALSAHLRRISLDVLNHPVPFEAAPAILIGFTVLLALFAFLCGRALVRRGAWIWPAALAAFIAALFAVHVVTDTRRDVGTVATATETLWSRDLGALETPWHDMTLLQGSRDGESFIAIRSGPNAYQVLDAANGEVKWKGESASRHPLSGARGVLFVIDGSTLSGRAIEDGRVLWTYEASQEVGLVFVEHMALLTVGSRSVVALDMRKVRHEVKPMWTFAKKGAKFFLTPLPGNLIIVCDQNSSIAYQLDNETGAETRSIKIRAEGNVVTRMVAGQLLWITSSKIERVDPSTGSVQFLFTLPEGRTAPEHVEPMRIAAVGTEHILLQRGRMVYSLDMAGNPRWELDAGETIAMHEQGSGVVFMQTASGKMIGLQPDSGRISWEWWPGGLLEHVFPSEVAELAYLGSSPLPMLQQKPGDPLCVFDSSRGRIGWRHAVPDGFRIRRVLDDGRALLVLGRNAQDHVILQAMPRPNEIMRSLGSPY